MIWPRYSHWKDNMRAYEYEFYCTFCGKDAPAKFNFCPNCGAFMLNREKD